MDAFLKSLEFLIKTAPPPIQVLAAPIWEKLTTLRTILGSAEYPCPICAYHNKRGEDQGKITLSWDVEYDEYYPASAMPVFSGTCGDEPTVFGNIRPRNIFSMGKMLPYSHSEQLNEMMEDSGGDISEQCAYILGAAQERRRIAELMGLRVKTWGDL